LQGLIASHVTHPRLIKRRHVRKVAERMIFRIECLDEMFDRYLKGFGVEGPPFPPVRSMRRRDVRSEWREAQGSAKIDPQNPGTHERNVCTRKRTSAPPLRMRSVLGEFAFRDQYPRRCPWRLFPSVSLSRLIRPRSRVYTYISVAYICHEYFDAPRNRLRPIDKPKR